MDTYIDIETLPDVTEGALEKHIQSAKDNFHAPSGMTKGAMVAELKTLDIEYDKDAKFTSAGDIKLRWEAEFAESLSESVGMENYRKTALTDDGCICVICAKTENGTMIKSLDSCGGIEGVLLREAFDQINHLIGQREPYFIGHNIPWDLERLYHKAVMLGVNPGFKLPFDGRHDSQYYDTMQAWAGFKKTISQKALCDRLGIPTKTDMDGSRVFDVWQEDPERVAAYCLEDVLAVEQMHKRLTFRG